MPLDSLVSRDYFLSAVGYLGNSRALMQRISFNPLTPVSSGPIVLYRKCKQNSWGAFKPEINLQKHWDQTASKKILCDVHIQFQFIRWKAFIWCIELGFLMLNKGKQKGEGSQRQEARVFGCLFTSENLPVPKYMSKNLSFYLLMSMKWTSCRSTRHPSERWAECCPRCKRDPRASSLLPEWDGAAICILPGVDGDSRIHLTLQ